MTKMFCLALYLRDCTSYDCGFWYTCIKRYLQQFFFIFFKILIFWVFQSSSVNAKRKFCGVPHLLHMCLILYLLLLFIVYLLLLIIIYLFIKSLFTIIKCLIFLKSKMVMLLYTKHISYE